MRRYEFLGSDGNGGYFRGVTKIEYGSMHEAIADEIIKIVHSVILCGAYIEGKQIVREHKQL